MRKPWTTREEKKCAVAYSTLGLDAAVRITKRSKLSVYRKMCESKVRSAHYRGNNFKKEQRRWFREDIGFIFELMASGLNSEVIAEYYDTTSSSIRGAVALAKQGGFDAYPLRNK
jgi:hypothetical protein